MSDFDFLAPFLFASGSTDVSGRVSSFFPPSWTVGTATTVTVSSAWAPLWAFSAASWFAWVFPSSA